MEDYGAFGSRSMNDMVDNLQGIEDIPFQYENKDNGQENDEQDNVELSNVNSDGEEDYDEGVVHNFDEEDGIGDEFEDGVLNCEDTANVEEGMMINIDGIDDIGNLDLVNFSPHQALNVDFISIEVAFLFYTLYAKVKGFAVRKSKVIRGKNGDVVQQTFVCNREGYREDRGLTTEQRKRKQKLLTRCGCQAKIRVRVYNEAMRWCVTYFSDEHDHRMLDTKYIAMLPTYRKMGECDVMEMNYFRNAGIPPYLMYGSFACQSAGYENIGFSQKDIYNQIGKQRRKHESDAKACLEFLYGFVATDPMMFVSHTVDGKGRMQHLFWSDGTSQKDYEIFGDVLAFDATYEKNKYRCPVVVLSGVNHHNQTIVFAAAVVSNETEETYIWLLNEFLKVMKGKAPSSVVTDGDAAMRNAIRSVFPNAHHRLCAWHLSRNANTNVGIPEFTSDFTICMLGDLDVGQFNKMWNDMVEKFGLHDNAWVAQMYEKRKMWAVAYMRGKFFGGLRTTSRCEGLNAQIGRYVKSGYNLTEFVQHFNRCVNHMRFKEHEADFASHYGEPVLETDFHSLERSGCLVYTRDVFSLYCRVLHKSSSMVVVGCREASTYNIFSVVRKRGSGRRCFVSFYPLSYQFKCACQKMESMGIPCEHIVVVLVYLGIGELPKCLVLDRWTKFAKDSLQPKSGEGSKSLPSQLICRYAVLMLQYRELAMLAAKFFYFYCIEREKARVVIEGLKANVDSEDVNEQCTNAAMTNGLRDPGRVASRGKGLSSASCVRLKSKRKIKCSFCKIYGHNKKTCKEYQNYLGTMGSQFGTDFPWAEDDTSFNNEDYYVHVVNQGEYDD